MDPAAPDADGRIALLEYLLSLGATNDDLVEFRDQLPVVASMVAIRPSGARISLREIAARTGTSEEIVARLWRACALPAAGLDDPVAYEQSADLFALFDIGLELFGPEIGLQIARLVGQTTARLADALISSFMVSLLAPAVRRDPTLVALAEENARASTLIGPFMHGFEILLRHHLELATRPLPDMAADELPSYEARRLVIAFADLTGSTALAGRLTFAELGNALSEFESLCAEVINHDGGRVVKLIGDEVMFAVATVEAACEIACNLVDAIDAHPTLPPVRVGIVAGEVLARHGDVFGPVVNLAARLVAQAEPKTVLAPAATVPDIEATRSFRVEPAGSVALRGFDEDVEIVRVTRS